jgi:hypothetical protein
MARRRLRVYLGAAPGVAKTYATLAEGKHRRSRGTDAVVALVEAHGRRLTAAMAEGLEVMPRRTMSYRGATFTEIGRSLFARVRGMVVVPGRCARLRHRGGQLAVARVRGQLGNGRDLGDLQRRAVLDLGLGGVLVAEVRE